MDAATLNVVINATDSASAALQRVAGNVRALGSTTAGAMALTEEMNRQIAASSGVGSKTAMQIQRYASSMNATKDSIKALNRGLKDQQAVTQSGKAILEQHTKALDSKKAAVAAASQAYAQNTQAARANIAQLKGEQALIAATKNQRQNELTMLRETSKTLNTNTQEYKDNQQAIKWTQAELKDADARYKSVTNAIAEQERVIAGNKTAFQGAKAEMRQAVQDHAAMQSAVDASTASEEAYRQEIQRMEREYRRTGQQMLDRGQDLRQLGEGIDAVTKPIQIAGAAAGVGLGIASKAAIDFEDSFAAVQKTVDGTPEQLDAIKQSIIDMTTAGINGHKAIPLTTTDLTELAAAGGQLGILTENIVDYTETMAMLGTATNLYGEQGAATIARFMNVTNTAQGEVSNLGSTVVDLGNNYATTEAEIMSMALRMGKTGALLKMSAQDILAYSAATSSMGIEAEAGGGAISRVWMNIQSEVSAGGDGLKEFARISGKTSDEFAKQWEVDASGAYRDFLQGLGKMTAAEQISFLEGIGFNNQRDRDAILALSGEKGFQLLTDAIQRANTAWEENVALQREFETKSGTTASKISVLKNNAAEAARSFGEVMLPSLVDITGGLTGAAQSMAGWSDGTKKAAVNTALFLAGTGAAAKGTASLIKGAGGVMDGIGKIKAFAAASEGGGAALAAMGSAALPVVAGVAAVGGAVAGATVLMYAAGRAYEEYRADWSRGGYEMADSVREYVSAARELNAIQYELRQNQIIIDDPGSGTKAVEAAKTRVNELKQLLAEKYGLDIDVSAGELDAAIDKLKQIDYLTAKQNIAGLLKYGNAKNGDYNKAKDDAAYYREANDSIKAQKQATKDLKGELLLLDDALGKGSLSQEEYNKRFNELVEATGNPYFKDMPTEILKNGAAVEEWGKRLDKTKQTNEESLAGVEKTIAEYTQSMNDLANAGLAEIEFGDAEQGLEHIASAVKNANLSMNDWAVTAALAQGHIDSLSTAWQSGGDVLNNVIDNYVSNMAEFGASAQETAQGAALIANGFTTMDQAAKAGSNAVQNVMNSLKDIAEKYDLDIDINADGTVIWTNDTTEPDSYQPDNKPGEVDYSADFSAIPSTGPAITGVIRYTAQIVGGALSAVGSLFKKNAAGTDYFGGGLAMVNDQKGITDPRELIVDGGHAFIPDGRDVVLPLSKGAKIYTAAQTKAIMAGMGIPHYAGGKDNSESFTNVTDEWRHYTATHAVTATQEFEKWNDLLKSAAETTKDIWDAQEHVYSSQVKINKELDSASYDYIKNRNFNNDWGDYGDDPFAAFDRFSERQLGAAEASQQTWTDAYANIHKFGEELFDGRVDQSLRWIEHEKKYNDLALEDEMKLYQQMQGYVNDYYEKGLITQEKAREASTQINERYLDANEELIRQQSDARQAEYDAWEKDMTNWKRIHDTYDDWDEIGDSVSQMYGRAIVRQQEFFDNGVIDWQEYRDRTLDYQLEMYSAASSEYDAMLRKQADEIARLRDQFSKEETALRDSWAVADRRTDMSEVDRLLGIYENAATDAGQQRYKELLEQKKQLEREEQLYRLQQDNNATLDALQEDYDKMEADKKRVLASLKLYNADISHSVESTRDIAEQIGIDYANAADSTLDTLSDIYGLLRGISGLIRDRNSMYKYEKQRYVSGEGVRIAGGTVRFDRTGAITAGDVFSMINSAVVKGAGGF